MKQRGFMLALMLIFVVILFLLGAAIAALSFPEFFFINRHSAQTSALYIADAGIKDAIYRIQSGNMSNFSSTIVPDLPTGTTTFGTYTVTIVADAGNADNAVVMYHVTSVGSLTSRPNDSRTIKAIVQGVSFAKFLYFTDEEKMRGGGERIWFKTGDILDGPVHSNDQISVYWGDHDSYPPIFQSEVESASDFYYSPDDPATENDYKEIFLNGSNGYQTNVSNIPFPPSISNQKQICLGGITEPSSTGVYLPTTGGTLSGGIYIVGDIERMTFSTSSNTQIISIVQIRSNNQRTTTISLDQANNTTTYNYNGTITNYSGLPKGLIFGTGNIKDLSGTVNWRLTLFTDNDQTNNYINITNNLQYAQDPRTNFSFNGAMGIVAPDITVDRNAPDEINIQAAIMAADTTGRHGSFYVDNYAAIDVKGHINLLGGIIQNWRGPVGTYWTNSGEQKSGYLKNYHHDARFLTNPPPYFPMTGNFNIRFWKILQ